LAPTCDKGPFLLSDMIDPDLMSGRTPCIGSRMNMYIQGVSKKMSDEQWKSHFSETF
jgi:hypothetical protein